MGDAVRRLSTERNASERAVLQSFLERQDDGATLAWTDIEKATGVKMDKRGRALVRQALKSLRRPCETIRGSGIRLSSKDTAIDILGGGFRTIGNSIKRVHRVHADLSQRHLSSLDHTDKERMILAGSFLGALVGNVTDAARALPAKVLPQPDPKAVAKG